MADPESTVICCLDSRLRIVYCNSAWDRFAVENGAPHLCRPAPIGHCILDFISGPDRDYFEKHYRTCLLESQLWERDYECSSAKVHRTFRMRVLPLQSMRGLLVIFSLQVERPHELAGSPPLEDLYRSERGLIMMCASCRRTRRDGPDGESWDWIPSFVDRMPLRTSHGICTPCMELHYREDGQ
jgi:hypothetical protein